MAKVLLTSVLLLSAQLVASQGSSKCGRPLSYPGKRLDEKYEQQSEFEDGKRVAYKCAVGYRQSEGTRVTYCRNGQWEPLDMTCTKKVCGSAGEIVDGRFEQEGNLFGDKAYAKCNEGFVLQGESVRECLDSGWSGTIPTCVESLLVSNSSPPSSGSSSPPSGSSPLPSGSSPPSSGSSLPLSRSFFPDPSITEVTALTCKHPRRNSGTFNETKTVYKPGESLSFSCGVGFQPIGNISIKCQPTGHWTRDLPKCVTVKCPELKIPHTRGLRHRVRFNMTVKITCEDAFQLKGVDLITCAANGSWSPAVPTCEKETGPEDRHIQAAQAGQCDRLPHYPNALPREEYLSRRQYKSGDAVRFMCTHGYRWARGSSTIRCRNGHWTALQMRCEKRTCGSAGEIQNGRFHYTGISYGDTATAVCSEGYQLFGIGVRRCRGDGWDARVPVCEVVQCPEPQEVRGAEMSEPIDGPVKYSHVVSYRCLSGSLIGARDIYCTENGTWSAPPPQCREISCPYPTVRNGARIFGFRSHYNPGHRVKFTCNPGWKIRDSDSATCGIDGKWNPELPKCVSRAAAHRNSAK